MARERVLAAADASVVLTHPFVASAVLSDYWRLTKPEVSFLIAVTTAAGFYLGCSAVPSPIPWIPFLHTLLGTLLVASGAAVLNQWMEYPFDAMMRRTARRAVAAGRIDPKRALMFGAFLSLAGLAYLLLAAGVLPSLLALVTLVGYLCIYTPLKRITPLCTLVGAIPGAVPPLIGWTAARGRLDGEAWILFGIVFLWQFPHFMSIAWMYRDDYARARYLVLPDSPMRGAHRYAANAPAARPSVARERAAGSNRGSERVLLGGCTAARTRIPLFRITVRSSAIRAGSPPAPDGVDHLSSSPLAAADAFCVAGAALTCEFHRCSGTVLF